MPCACPISSRISSARTNSARESSGRTRRVVLPSVCGATASANRLPRWRAAARAISLSVRHSAQT
ncbi:hypothetical protein Q5530_09900 [Saccharothrix sp. BKS2]